MSEFKPILVYNDYFPNGMTDEEFVKFFLEAKQGKKKSLEDIVDLDKFYQQFDTEEAKEKLKEFMAKHHLAMPQQAMQQPLFASDELDKEEDE